MRSVQFIIGWREFEFWSKHLFGGKKMMNAIMRARALKYKELHCIYTSKRQQLSSAFMISGTCKFPLNFTYNLGIVSIYQSFWVSDISTLLIILNRAIMCVFQYNDSAGLHVSNSQEFSSLAVVPPNASVFISLTFKLGTWWANWDFVANLLRSRYFVTRVIQD